MLLVHNLAQNCKQEDNMIRFGFGKMFSPNKCKLTSINSNQIEIETTANSMYCLPYSYRMLQYCCVVVRVLTMKCY